ncbi:MAG: hypothetical protein ABIO46_07070 [Chitinophagales bacterium]
MKNHFVTRLLSIAILILLITFNFMNAQSKSSVNSIAEIVSQLPEPASVQFIISIPAEYSSTIIRENVENGSYFWFKKSDGSKQFLFQVNKISEGQWIGIKGQLNNPVILDHKNGSVYYVQVTDKSRIKGNDAVLYEQVYGRIRQMIGTIVITDEGIK